MTGGYGGSILKINLTDRKVVKEPTPDDLIKDYIGARGFIIRTLFKELAPGTDPLGPDAKFIMATGPLTGLFVPSSGKIQTGGKSPLTGGYGEANSGGHFPEELKLAGYDMIILDGQSEKPCYIVIDDDEVRIEDAGDLWGKGSFAVEETLKASLGDDFQIASIGPAGEKLVKIACITHDFGRQAGRTGLGAVLGSKKVKAICLRGTKAIRVHDLDGLMKVGRRMYEQCFTNPAFELWQTYGTSAVVNWANRIGAFPTRNFKSGYFEQFTNISGPRMRKDIVVINKACFACAMCCGKYSHAKTDKYDVYVEGPEYETTAMIGGDCALGNIKDVAYGNYLCDDYGIDTISGGSIAAFAIECFEKGIITEKDTGGLVLKFGDPESVFSLLKMIAMREGIGDVLAEGSKAAAEHFGGDSIKFAMQVKGLEQSGYETRRAPAMLLSYMTSDIGAHHRPSWAITHDIATGRESVEGKAVKVIELQHTRPLFDTLGVCRLPWIEMQVPVSDYAEAYRKATGIDYSEQDLISISERIWNLTRMFWVREVPGFGRASDIPPARVYEDKLTGGSTDGGILEREKIEAMLDDYYNLRGWTSDGIPTGQKLHELGLDWVNLP
ncbi:MAG: aldehyde ferredoxin oxidoreductase family protein [Candidatus Eisenbacteria bacterium]